MVTHDDRNCLMNNLIDGYPAHRQADPVSAYLRVPVRLLGIGLLAISALLSGCQRANQPESQLHPQSQSQSQAQSGSQEFHTVATSTQLLSSVEADPAPASASPAPKTASVESVAAAEQQEPSVVVSSGQVSQPAPTSDVTPVAPHSWPRTLHKRQLPAIYGKVWKKAENRQRCPLLGWPASSDLMKGVKPRSAYFGGGWAVAYDRKGHRSEFGIAGTGVTGPVTYRWPETLRWADGSQADFGLEAGVGPKWLAYVRVAGSDCLYNVWSARGREHLLTLLSNLHTVTR